MNFNIKIIQTYIFIKEGSSTAVPKPVFACRSKDGTRYSFCTNFLRYMGFTHFPPFFQAFAIGIATLERSVLNVLENM